jgi:hypothetical protein
MDRARGIVVAAALALAATASCLGHLPPCPAAGGPAWTELEGTHFRLWTDLDPPAARLMLTDLEQFQSALLAVFGAPPDLDVGRIPAIAVDRGWTDFAAGAVDGYFTKALFQPRVVMWAGSRLASQEVVRHELVHYLSGKIIRNQPPWLSEGLATYYETIEYDESAGRITVGRPSPLRLRFVQQTGVSGIASTLTATRIERDNADRFYAAAWITTHYLMNHRPEAMLGYQKALRGGATAEAAWKAAFGSETPADVAQEVRRYLDGGQYAMLIYQLRAPKLPAPTERRLTDADVHATRAFLYVTGNAARAVVREPSIAAGDANVAARRELAEAQRQQPGHAMAAEIAHYMLGAPADLGQATLASQTSPDDWLAWLLLAEACRQRGDLPCREKALARAEDLARANVSISVQFIRHEH